MKTSKVGASKIYQHSVSMKNFQLCQSPKKVTTKEALVLKPKSPNFMKALRYSKVYLQSQMSSTTSFKSQAARQDMSMSALQTMPNLFLKCRLHKPPMPPVKQ